MKELTKGRKLAREKVRDIGMRYRILRDRTGSYVRPADAYLPYEFASRPDEKEALRSVEHFFKLAGGRPFVAPDYLEDGAAEKSSRGSLKESDGTKVVEDWRKFLLELGVSDYPRLEKFELEGKGWWEIQEEAEKRGFSCPRYTRPGLALVDWDVDGLAQVMERLANHPTLDDVKAIWSAMAWLYYRLSEEEVVKYYENGSIASWPRMQEVRYATLSFFYYRQQHRRQDATWVRTLRSRGWLLDQDERPELPKELFSHGLKVVLGSKFRFLHPELPMEYWHREFAEKLLGIRFRAELEDVLENLRATRDRGDAGKERVFPIYEHLERQRGDREELRTRFSQEPLILVPGQGWFKTEEVCWRDDVGFVLPLEPCWGERLRSFFLPRPPRCQ